MKESDIRAAFLARVRARGDRACKLQWEGRTGAPDWVVMSVFNPRTVWVELKQPGESLKRHQKEEHARMREHGQCVIVIDSLESLDIWFPAP